MVSGKAPQATLGKSVRMVRGVLEGVLKGLFRVIEATPIHFRKGSNAHSTVGASG